MKYAIYVIITLIIIAGGYVAYTFITTKNHSPADTMVFQDGGFLLTVDYSRPYKKGRIIFGEKEEDPLLPYGEYWRTGANEATEIDFNKDVRIAGNQMKAGRYRLYTIPGKEEWIVGLNSELGKWGYSEPDFSKDVLRFPVIPQKADSVCEQFLIAQESIQSNKLVIHLCWDETIVPFMVEY